MSLNRPVAISMRSYGERGGPHAHDHAQLVLPIAGSMRMTIEGRTATIGGMDAAYVGPGQFHDQQAREQNSFVIMDIAPKLVAGRAAELLHAQSFVKLSAPARKLVEYVRLVAEEQRGSPPSPDLCNLLLRELALQEVQRSPLDQLCGEVRANLGENWTVESMAAIGGMSSSSLHAAFRDALGTTPRRWLAEARLYYAQELMATTDQSIAQIAFQVGYSDQTALTRAMRTTLGFTPAAFRRSAKKTKSRIQ